ncbi:hypothetical protein BSPWISOXPB_3410 [uncultured Gammaproteobacteria bacterium]|nr:hypothetical protein BSPWISOXPB_3410 [uncultured Gammaproteobacteria bacterium]
MCQSLKDILVDKDKPMGNLWLIKKAKPLMGKPLLECATLWYEGKVFDLIVQRSVVTGQVELDLGLDLDLNLNSNNNTQAPEQITTGPYIYRAIATNLEILE